jgi:hypothetical protein
VLVIGSAWLTPLAGLLSDEWRELPLLAALATIALLGNGSAIQRLASIRASVRQRAAATTPAE